MGDGYLMITLAYDLSFFYTWFAVRDAFADNGREPASGVEKDLTEGEGYDRPKDAKLIRKLQDGTVFVNKEDNEVLKSWPSLEIQKKVFEKLQQDIPRKGVKDSLEVLCYVYALFLLHKRQGDFLATGYLTPKQASLANAQLINLYLVSR
nr:peroxisomal acyl-coenzyme A oxidase 1 [Tanacetum cinerariifolium]